MDLARVTLLPSDGREINADAKLHRRVHPEGEKVEKEEKRNRTRESASGSEKFAGGSKEPENLFSYGELLPTYEARNQESLPPPPS